MFAGQERWFHKRFLSVGSDGSWERMIVMFSLAHRTVLIANNIRLMSKEMEPKVSINDLKKIRSFSRQRNMVCSRHSEREREREEHNLSLGCLRDARPFGRSVDLRTRIHQTSHSLHAARWNGKGPSQRNSPSWVSFVCRLKKLN